MIGTKTRGILLSALALGALGLGGCATKKYVNEQVGVVDTRVSAHETKLGELDQTSREALERAYDLAPQKTMVAVPYAQALMMKSLTEILKARGPS